MFGIRPKAGRRIRQVAAFAMLTGLFVTTVGYVSSSAVPIGPGSGTGFEIEGNQADAANDPAIDWSSIIGSPNLHVINDPEPDDGIGQGAKENEPHGWGCHVGNPPKDDILKVAINERISPAAAYLDLADVRAAGTGDTHINFEFNQNPVAFNCDGTGFTGRTDGDLLLLLEFPGNGTAAVDVFRWDNTPGDAVPPVDDPEGDGAWIPDASLPQGLATGAENDAAIPAAQNVLFGTGDIPERAFAEVSVNLGLVLHEDPNSTECHRFGSVSVRSRTSGESLESELKDIVGPTPINLSTCGGVKIHKEDDAGNPLAGAQFGLYTSQALAATRLAANALSTCTSIADGSCTFDEVAPGNYFVAEISAPAGYNIDPDIVPVAVAFRTVTDVAAPFVDPRQVGFVRVHKVLHDQGGATITPPAGALDGTTFLLYQDANDNGSYDAGEEAHIYPNGPVATCSLSGGSTTCDMGPVVTGDYRVTETVVPPNSSSAGDVDVTVTEGTAQAPVVIDFVNVLAPINIHLDKAGPDTANIGDVITYTFDVTTTGPRLHNIQLAELVDVCPGNPTYVSGDTNNDGFLVVGETWHYTCQHTITLNDPDPLPNSAQVTGTDDYGRNVSSTDTHLVDILHPDVTVTKDAVDGSISAGDQAQFTITVNVGGEAGSIARSVTLSDPLPAGLTWTDNSADCSVSNGTLSCSFGDLAFGASRSVTVTATTSSANCGDLVNTATVAATNELPAQQGNNSDGATIHVSCPDVSVLKTTDTPTVNAGDPVQFTIVVTNNDATGTATHVTLTDPLPAGVTWTEDSNDCSITGSTLSCDFGDLGPLATRTVHVSGTTDAADCGQLVNTATVASTNEPPSASGNNSSTATITVLCPDVSVLKTADNGTISAGDTAAFTIVVSNSGQGIARAVTLNDTLPAGVTWTEDSPDCSITAGVMSCSFGDLASGATRTIHVSGVTDAADCGVLSNTATVGATNEPASALSNNTSTATITVQCPDISITKVADSGTVSAGDDVGFTIAIHNDGPGEAKDVTINDPLPADAGLSWSIQDASAPGCAITLGTLHCDLGNLADGATVTVHITSPTTAATCGDFTNVATGDASNDDPVTADDSITVLCPGLNFTKSPDNGLVEAGQDVVFTLTVSNAGPGDAHDVVVDDPLPAGLTWSVDDNRCAIANSALHCVFGTMAAGTSIVIHVTAHTTTADCGLVDNTGSASASNDDTVTDDGHVRVRCPIDITIDKTGPALAHVGDVVTYTMKVTNSGLEDLVNVVLTDPICNAGTLKITDDGDGDSTLAIGETWTYTCDHTVLASDPDPLPNTATVVGHDADDRTTTDTDDHVVDIIHPAITIVKTANPISVEPGATVTFTYVVTNTGDCTLTNVTVVDDVLGAIGTIPSLAPGESATLTKTMTAALNSPTRNVGTSTGTDVLGKQVSAQDDATITVVLPEVIERALPRTGQESVRLVALGLALVLGGGLVLMLPGTTRRRREGEA